MGGGGRASGLHWGPVELGMKNGTRSHGSMRSMAGCVGGLGKGRSMRSGKGGWAGGGVRGWWG